jgi:RNA polymerase sigma factor (sigma-70 family)
MYEIHKRSNYTLWSDDELLVAVRAGDERAWEEILRRYGKLVAWHVRAILVPHCTSPDGHLPEVVQEVWLKTFIYRYKVQKLRAWLNMISPQKAAEHLRGQCSRKRRRANALYEDAHQPERLTDFSRALEAKVLLERLFEKLRELDSDDQDLATIFTLRLDKGLEFHEIAQILNIKPNTAQKRFYRALASLKKAFGVAARTESER